MIFDIPKERQSFLNVFNGALFLVKADAMQKSTNKNIFVKIICIMVDVMYETPERDVFY